MGLRATVHLIDQNLSNMRGEAPPEPFEVLKTPPAIDLDKSWHALHYLIPGDHFLSFLHTGWQLENVSEHCEAHSLEDVLLLNEQFASRSIANMMSRYTPEQFDQLNIYDGPGWNWEMKEYIESNLLLFRKQIDHAVRLKCGMLIVIC